MRGRRHQAVVSGWRGRDSTECWVGTRGLSAIALSETEQM